MDTQYIQESKSVILLENDGAVKANTLRDAEGRDNLTADNIHHSRSKFHVGRFHPFIVHEGPSGEYRYSSTLFLTSALEGGEREVPFSFTKCEIVIRNDAFKTRLI